MIIDRPPLLQIRHPPQIDAHAVEQRDDGDNRECPGGSQRDVVAEIQERGGDRAEDDGEFELEDPVSIESSGSRRWKFDSPMRGTSARQRTRLSVLPGQAHGSSFPGEP